MADESGSLLSTRSAAAVAATIERCSVSRGRQLLADEMVEITRDVIIQSRALLGRHRMLP